MKTPVLLLAAALGLPGAALAVDLSQDDVGTYEWLNPDGGPTGVLYKLARTKKGQWTAQGRMPGHEWQDVSCGAPCDFHKSKPAEIKGFFPADWMAKTDLSCIHNQSQAFCRYSEKTAPEKQGHVVVVLSNGQWTVVLLRKEE